MDVGTWLLDIHIPIPYTGVSDSLTRLFKIHLPYKNKYLVKNDKND